MNIPLNQFEQHISEAILKRGLSYFKNGAVENIDEIAAGVHFAIVSGFEHYEVEIKIKNSTITNIDCDCPYNGDICKHAVAVLFALQAEELQLHDEQLQINKKSKKPKTEKAKTPKEQLHLLLNKLEKDELITSILELVAKDKSLLYQLLSKYSYLNQEQTQEFYTTQITNIIKIAADRNGYFDFYETRKLNKPMDELLTTAKNESNKTNKQTAIFICLATLTEISKILNEVDDSNGYVHGFIQAAFEILITIADSDNLEYKNELFTVSIQKLSANKNNDFGLYNNFITLAVTAINTKEEVALLKPYLLSIDNRKYDNEFFAQTELDLIERFEGGSKANDFLLNNLQHSSFREKAINNAIDKKDYLNAKKYAQEGIEQDKELVGLLHQWQKKLLHIAELENDKKTIIELALFLFYDNRYSFEYYNKAKKHTTTKEWKEITSEILNKLNSNNNWKPYDTIAKVYFEEKEFDMLLKTITGYATFELLEKYESVLNENFPDNLVMLYERSIRKYLEHHVERKYYVIACKAIKRLKKIISNNNVDHLINEFKLKYKNRKALIELINKI
jgi:uncharacterized Zn finger protein